MTTGINARTGGSLEGLPTAEVIKVSRPVWYWQEGSWDGSRIVAIRCPYCRGVHRHGWLESQPEPGDRVAHCRAPDPGGYHIPAPAPHIPIPGLCGRRTAYGTSCARPVAHEGSPCNLHRSQR
jgi:hypothetical protein